MAPVNNMMGFLIIEMRKLTDQLIKLGQPWLYNNIIHKELGNDLPVKRIKFVLKQLIHICIIYYYMSNCISVNFLI